MKDWHKCLILFPLNQSFLGVEEGPCKDPPSKALKWKPLWPGAKHNHWGKWQKHWQPGRKSWVGHSLGSKSFDKLPCRLGKLEGHTHVQGRMRAQKRPEKTIHFYIKLIFMLQVSSKWKFRQNCKWYDWLWRIITRGILQGPGEYIFLSIFKNLTQGI